MLLPIPFIEATMTLLYYDIENKKILFVCSFFCIFLLYDRFIIIIWRWRWIRFIFFILFYFLNSKIVIINFTFSCLNYFFLILFLLWSQLVYSLGSLFLLLSLTRLEIIDNLKTFQNKIMKLEVNFFWI